MYVIMPVSMKQTKCDKKCYFLSNGIRYADYRDIHVLNQFLDTYGRLMPRRRTGLSAKYHRMVTRAVKRARYMALLPYVRREAGQ